ncbi:MAG: TatD family hydrolase [Alphaproteobacteria bacterium]|nr:TatD family hydrolase [Alphaproteobacteria bacterium]
MSAVRLVDSHCHLDYPDFAEEGVEAVVRRAEEAGVTHFLTICVEVEKFQQVLDVAEKFSNMHCTVGTHPHHAAEELHVTREELVRIAANPKVVGIGETGLDYYYNHSPAEEQKKGFATHIEAALETRLPLVVHTRDADVDTIDVLTSAGQKDARGVMHCFSGDINLARKSLDLGFYISFSGIITFKKADELREVVKFVPQDRMLIETDAPYLAPMPHRGKRNEPSFVKHTANMVAQIKEMSLADVGDVTARNFFSLFDKIEEAV